MMKVAISGFGRIGRNAFKAAYEKHKEKIEIVAINDLAPAHVLAHLLKYDSNYGVWNREVSSEEFAVLVGGKRIPVFAEKEPLKLPWKDLKVDVVIECTGKFTDKEGAMQHIQAGAKKVVISAPSKGKDPVPTLVLGVNEETYKGEEVVNNASCTTNCIAPVVEVINKKFGIVKAMMTTIHAYTQDQNLQDGSHKDLRRARAAAQNIIPTSTGAAIATTEAIPSIKGLFDGRALRVPVAVGSISDLTFLLKKKVTVDGINQALKEASEGQLKGILAVTSDPVVSSDIIGREESSIVDLGLTQVVDGDMVKVFAWYDNEWGYCNRLIEQVIIVGTY